jgi:hypothetical protein
MGKDLTKPEGQNIVAIKQINYAQLQKEDDYLAQCVLKEI